MPMPVSATIIAGALVTRMLTRPRSVYLTALDSSWWRMNSSHLLSVKALSAVGSYCRRSFLRMSRGAKSRIACRMTGSSGTRVSTRSFVGLPNRA